jgi:hypothetical protein
MEKAQRHHRQRFEKTIKLSISAGIRRQAASRSRLCAYAFFARGEMLMIDPQADDQAARQILAVFARYNVTVAGVLRRHQFFEVRDSDFQRGMDGAVARGWIQRHPRDRYRYFLTTAGREAFNTVLVPMTGSAAQADVIPLRP